MLTLAVDTAGEIGSIALADDDRVLGQVRLESPGGFGQMLFGQLEKLLSNCGVRLADVDLYAAGCGPGSFTGVRIGLAAVKGLAEVAEKPALGISNLAALAACGSADLRAAVIDARRGEVYAAVFDREGREVVPPAVLPLADFVESAGDRPVEWVTMAVDIGRAATVVGPELAGAIAKLAIERFRSGAACDPAAMEAEYVRRPDINAAF
ncbi:MAG TPA: tRNA (adenosine(37)-N6)-threonylcarbamoyltransferase complex dimerization subunit type 1 TsaB [Bryobacteraceae bacterium]|nr:tRNA (adenosine(37)-N6)-threonylcarbamoyltransferase complex dimerization subunit type 1 TsaB [Bryobacteraceae bacterium]